MALDPAEPADPTPARHPYRPAIRGGLIRLQRAPGEVQLGLGSARSAVLAGLPAAAIRVLRRIDGTSDVDDLLARAAELGLDRPAAERLLDALAEAGLLVDVQDTDGATPAPVPSSLEPDVRALELLPGPAGSDAYAVRASAHVEVRGAGRVGASIATLLASAGVGRVAVVDASPAVPADRCPAGIDHPADGGPTRERLVRARVRAIAPPRPAREPVQRGPCLLVLAPDGGPDALLTARSARRSEAHLLAYVRETRGVVGPLVEPGLTGCLQCVELHRGDRDPAWPRLLDQLARRSPSAACETTLATLVAAQAAMQALAYVDGRYAAAGAPLRNAALETDLADGITRARAWSPHPACGCRWATPVGPLTFS